MPTIFISYRREDSAGYAGRLHEELEERLGAQLVFRDVDTLRAGQDFEDAIRRRLEQCHACVVMIGPGWLKSQTAGGERRLHQRGDYVCMEIAAALSRAEVLVIPVLVGGATMPAQDDLPDSIRPLARRHAMNVRDETWETDMDRLAEALRSADGAAPAARPQVASSTGLPRYVVPVAIAVLVVAGILTFARKDTVKVNDNPPAPAPGAGVVAPDAAAAGPAYAIDVPSTGSEVSLGELIYTPLTGSVQRRGTGMRVWLRIRVSNSGFYSANLWDDSFRLVVGGQIVPASGGLNEVLDRSTIAQVVVRFDVPTATTQAMLRIADQKESGELSLDLSGNGSPPRHEEPDPRDGLSHAVFTAVQREEAPLVSAGELSTTLMRSSVRRFANKQRLTVVVKWNNQDKRYPVASRDLVLRLAVGGEVLAPLREPSEVVNPGATYLGDVVFEVPPATRSVVLTASIRDAAAERTLELR